MLVAMLPRAALHDRSASAGVRRTLRPLAWWRSKTSGWFVIGHCATAGLLQLSALVIALLGAGRPLPSTGALLWAALGLALIALMPALLTAALRTVRPPRRRTGAVIQALVIGVAFYAMLPLLVLGSALGVIALFVPVAVTWHALLGLGPALESDDQVARAS